MWIAKICKNTKGVLAVSVVVSKDAWIGVGDEMYN